MTTIIRTLSEELSTTASHADHARTVVQAVQSGLETGADAADAIDKFYNDAKKLEDLAESIEKVTGVLSKFGPVGKIVDLLDRVIEKVEDRIEDLREAAGKTNNSFKNLSKVLNATKDGMTAVDIALINTSSDIKAGIDSLNDVEGLFGVDRALLDEAQRATLGKMDELLSSLDSNGIGKAQTALATIANSVNGIPALLNPIDGMTLAIQAASKALAKVTDKLEPLYGPLKTIETVLSPVSWVLDKADWLVSKVVDPLLDPILEKTGIIDKINDVANTITNLLPSIDVFQSAPVKVAAMISTLGAMSPSQILAELEEAVIGRVLGEGGVLGELMNVGDGSANMVLGRNDILSTKSDLNGGAEDNVMSAAQGTDRMTGGDGNDIMIDGQGDDHYDGGAGFDAVYFDTDFSNARFAVSPNGIELSHGEETDALANVEAVIFNDAVVDISEVETVRVIDYADGKTGLAGTGSADLMIGGEKSDTINGKSGNDEIFGQGGNDKLIGGNGHDMLSGGAGNDRLSGGSGKDNLIGGKGNDWLHGGAGNDRLEGGEGVDTLSGGKGSDSFVFSDADVAETMARDVIKGFSQGDDVIDLSAMDAVSGTPEEESLVFIGEAAFSGTAGELQLRQEGGNTYVEADLDGDATADFGIEVTGMHSLTADDFIF